MAHETNIQVMASRPVIFDASDLTDEGQTMSISAAMVRLMVTLGCRTAPWPFPRLAHTQRTKRTISGKGPLSPSQTPPIHQFGLPSCVRHHRFPSTCFPPCGCKSFVLANSLCVAKAWLRTGTIAAAALPVGFAVFWLFVGPRSVRSRERRQGDYWRRHLHFRSCCRLCVQR
jgi:hypothetical protein